MRLSCRRGVLPIPLWYLSTPMRILSRAKPFVLMDNAMVRLSAIGAGMQISEQAHSKRRNAEETPGSRRLRKHPLAIAPPSWAST